MRLSTIILLSLLLQGCVVADVVTTPVKIVSKTADVLTTSQSKSDQKRGKRLREHEERLGKLERERVKAAEKCERGDEGQCRKLQEIDVKIAEEERREI